MKAGTRTVPVTSAVALILCTLALPAQQPAPPEEVPPPLFGGSVVPPEHLTTLTVGVGATRAAGPLAVILAIRAGEDPQLSAWQVHDPLSEPAVRMPIAVGMLFQGGFQGAPEALFGTRLHQLVLLHVGHYEDLWTLRDPDQVLPVSRTFLSHVEDGKGIPPADKGDPELFAYADMIAKASQTSARGFFQVAKKDITYAHLMQNPEKYRGEVVFLQGQLKRVRRFDPPVMLQGETLKNVYEGWIFYRRYGPKAPFCVLFTDLPAGIEVSEDMDVPVEFAGYFYKRYSYVPAENATTGKGREVPLLIGHSVRPVSEPSALPPGVGVWPREVLTWFVAGFATVMIIVFALGLWYRRNDQKIKTRLATLQTQEVSFSEMDQEDPPETPPDSAGGVPPGGEYGDRLRLHRPGDPPES